MEMKEKTSDPTFQRSDIYIIYKSRKYKAVSELTDERESFNFVTTFVYSH